MSNQKSSGSILAGGTNLTRVYLHCIINTRFLDPSSRERRAHALESDRIVPNSLRDWVHALHSSCPGSASEVHPMGGYHFLHIPHRLGDDKVHRLTEDLRPLV